MKKVAIVTDSNAGIRQEEAKELGIFVLPMPFTIDDQTYYEDINLTHEEFFEKQLNGAEIFTSQPVVGNVKELWDQILKDYDEIVHIPMSSGLSGSCQTAMMLAQEYDNRVFVVDSQRISVTQKYDVIDAKRLADQGKSGQEISDILTENKLNASIYITVNTLDYLKKGGRITPAVATLAGLLKIVPIMKLNYDLGGKIDTFGKVRTAKKANLKIIDHIVNDCKVNNKDYVFAIEHVLCEDLALEMKQKLIEQIGECEILVRELPAVVGAHMGIGGIGYQYIRKYEG